MAAPIHKVGPSPIPPDEMAPDDVPVVVVGDAQPVDGLVFVGARAAYLFMGIFNALDPAIGQARPAVAMDLARAILAGPLAQLLLPKE